MKFKIYRQHGALNSEPIFNAVETGLRRLGHEIVDNNEDIPVIWSVLWQGRMQDNKQIYHAARKKNKPVLIVEIGTLKRNVTWKLCLNNINNLGVFANNSNLNYNRPSRLGLQLKDHVYKRRGEILVALQHTKSLQWEGQPAMQKWAYQQIQEIRKWSDRPVIIRPHPRCPITIPNVKVERPTKLKNSYDDYDMNYNYHCIVNFCSGPGILGAIHGTPVIVSDHSLAYPVTQHYSNIESSDFRSPQRDDWFVKLCHTEWLVSEIENGTALEQLLLDI